MHLSATCTRCQSKYQLDASMRGKRMRCPNPICRAVFEVRDDNDQPAAVAEAPPQPPEPAPPTPLVEDFPGDDEPASPGVRCSEPLGSPPVAEPKQPLPPKPVDAKKTDAIARKPVPKPEVPPKPVDAKKTDAIARKPVPKPVAPPIAVDEFPDDFPGDDEAAPHPTASAVATVAWQPETSSSAHSTQEAISAGAPPAHSPRETISEPAPRSARRWALWAIVLMLLVLAGVGGVSWWRIDRSIATNEAERFQAAEKLYEKREFAEASAALQKLNRDFPDSAHSKKYRFLAELADVREAVYAPRESSDESANALQRVLQFGGVYKSDPLLKEREADVWQALDDLARQLTQSAESDKSSNHLALAKRAWTETKNYAAPANVSKSERERKLEDDWTRIDAMLVAHHKREGVIALIKRHTEKASAAGVEEAWTFAEKTKRAGDPEIRGLLSELFKAHREQITFVTDETPSKAAPSEDALPSLSVTPLVKLVRPVKTSKPQILALARGVLYALEPTKGELRWARRVGIDTQVLPLSVPADAITPELLLVLSSDQRSLSAVIAETGQTFWQTPLSDACVGTPVLVERTVLVATVAGQIDEIEIAEGRRLGSYNIGQPMTLGGVQQPGTSLVYFPADDFCVYEFDITKRSCTNILYTRHAAGSLRGLPIVARADKKDVLLVSQAQGPGRADVKAYGLPIEQPDQKPLEPTISVGGLSAAPWHDANRLALLSETGFLSLWGYRQAGTLDPLLFPFLKQDFALDASKIPGRCRIVHADAENLWTLARGRLQRVETAFDPHKGPDLVARWSQPIALGNLLHAAQAVREPGGRTILFVTTQADEHAACLCSAIDADEGKILWQRQLGVMPQQPPQLVGGQVVVPDVLGLLAFAPSAEQTEKPWRQAGEWLVHEPFSDSAHVLLTTDKSFVRLSWLRNEKKLRIQQGQVPAADKIRSLEVILPAPPNGTPALTERFVFTPLQNGLLVRIDLQDGAFVNGPDWRAAGAEEQAKGHVLALSATEFAVTDGSRGIVRLSSADGKSWDKRTAKQFSHRIIAAPLQITDADKARLCVADASNTLTLLDADRLTELKRWPMAGKITAGPFVRAGKIGCIVGKSRLVWLDPNETDRLWEYAVPDIVGEPSLIDGVLVIADAAGQFRALDPSSGRPLGNALTLKANVAATASPLPFGAGKAFVPLTDGTAIVLPLEKLR